MGYEVVEAACESQGWNLAVDLTQHPLVDVAVLDIDIPAFEGDSTRKSHSIGIRLAGRIKRACPRLGVVLFSAFDDRRREIVDLLHEGIGGLAYILKGCAPEQVMHAIDLASVGQIYIDPHVTNTRDLANELFDRLTPEEKEIVTIALLHLRDISDREETVLSLLASSSSLENISTGMNITMKTVENHITSIYDKLRLKSEPSQVRRHILLSKICMISNLHLSAS